VKPVDRGAYGRPPASWTPADDGRVEIVCEQEDQ
jgi:hypothetical protein